MPRTETSSPPAHVAPAARGGDEAVSWGAEAPSTSGRANAFEGAQHGSSLGRSRADLKVLRVRLLYGNLFHFFFLPARRHGCARSRPHCMDKCQDDTI